MVAFIESAVETWNFIKNKIKTCKFDEMNICWLKSAHNYLEKSARKLHILLIKCFRKNWH